MKTSVTANGNLGSSSKQIYFTFELRISIIKMLILPVEDVYFSSVSIESGHVVVVDLPQTPDNGLRRDRAAPGRRTI